MPSFTPGTLHKYSFPVQNIVISATVATQACLGNTRRIALGIYSSESTMVIYPTSSGLTLSQIKPALGLGGGYWFLAGDTGPLCQLEWYAYCTNPGVITVLEVVEEA